MVVYQKFFDGRYNINKMKLRCISFQCPPGHVVDYAVDKEQVPFEFNVTRWDERCHLADTDPERFDWHEQKMGFRACDFVEELHTYMSTDQEHDNFVIYQRNVADNGHLEMFMLSSVP